MYASLASGGRNGAAAWFHDCDFLDNFADVAGKVAVEDRLCHVYSNTLEPAVWDLEHDRVVNPWPLITANGGSWPDVIAVGETNSNAFLRPTDTVLQRIVQEQAQGAMLQPAVIPPLPTDAAFITEDQYFNASVETEESSDGPWNKRSISLIAGLVSCAILCMLVGCTVSMHVRRRHTRRTVRCCICCSVAPAALRMYSHIDKPDMSWTVVIVRTASVQWLVVRRREGGRAVVHDRRSLLDVPHCAPL